MWELLSESELNQEYSPSSVAREFERTVASYTRQSAEVLSSAESRRLQYGNESDEYIVVFESKPQGRNLMVVFLHGGYWQELSAEDSCFPATHFLDRGISYGAINYTLAPKVSISEIAHQCLRALKKLIDEYPSFSMLIVGSSAGAHLAAMLGAMNWGAFEKQKEAVAFVLVSGVFDLSPITRTYINAPLNLDTESALTVSPVSMPVQHSAPTLVCWGEFETKEFKRQSNEFVQHLTLSHVPVQHMEISGRDHFDILFDLADPSTQLGQKIENLIGDMK